MLEVQEAAGVSRKWVQPWYVEITWFQYNFKKFRSLDLWTAWRDADFRCCFKFIVIPDLFQNYMAVFAKQIQHGWSFLSVQLCLNCSVG